MRYFLAILLCFFLNNVQADEVKPPSVVWSKQDSTLMTSYLVLSTVDTFQTRRAIDRGGVELNPLYGSYPSTNRLVISKVIVALAVYYLADYDEADRTTMLIGANIIQGAVVLHNWKLLSGDMK